MSQRSRFHGGLKGHHSQGRQGSEPAGPGAWWQRQLRTLAASGKAPIKWLALGWGLLGACGACVSPWVPSPALPERRGGHSGRHTGCQNAVLLCFGDQTRPPLHPPFLVWVEAWEGTLLPEPWKDNGQPGPSETSMGREAKSSFLTVTEHE